MSGEIQSTSASRKAISLNGKCGFIKLTLPRQSKSVMDSIGRNMLLNQDLEELYNRQR